MIDLLNETRQGERRERPRIILSDMRRSDVPEVMKLEKRCCSLPWSSSAYVTEIGNPSAHYVVAKLTDGTLVGYGGVWVVMDEMHITTLAVDPSLRGYKIGERMLIALIYAGIERGALRATLEVRERNHIAHNLYLKYGFADVSIRKAYYSDNGENARIMWAEGVTSPQYQQMLQNNLRAIEADHGGAR